MAEVSFVTTCDAPLSVTFDYLDDPTKVTDYWHGMVSYRAIGEPDRGPGSVFEAESKIGPSTVKTTLKTVEWEKDVRVAYKSVSGMDTSTTFEFTAIDETHTAVALRVVFHIAVGLAGKALEKTLEPFVSASAKATSENIAREVARHYAARLAAGPRPAD